MTAARTTPHTLDIEVYAGDENRFEVQFFAGGVPLSLVGAALSAQARKPVSGAPVSLQAAFQDIDRSSGIVAMLWDGELVRTLLGGGGQWRGVWDLQVLMPGRLLPTTPVGGCFTARSDVTRP